MAAQVFAPWSPEQVRTLLDWQARGDVHELTCPAKGSSHHPGDGVLAVSPWGLWCRDCSYRQLWVPSACFMLGARLPPGPKPWPLGVFEELQADTLAQRAADEYLAKLAERDILPSMLHYWDHVYAVRHIVALLRTPPTL